MSTSYAFPVTTPGPASTRRRMTHQPGVRFAIGHAALVVVVCAAGVAVLGLSATTLLLALTIVVSGAGLGVGWTTGLGVSAWALATGFLEHQAGTLTFAGGDLRHLALLVGVGLATGLLGGRR